MSTWYFIGLDIHKKVIAYCVKTIDGRLVEEEGSKPASDLWMNG